MKVDYDCIVIGAGPAGITAAIYLKRANINCLVIEKGAPGGQLNKSSIIENYPGFDCISGSDLASKFYKKIEDLKVPYMYGEVTEIVLNDDYKTVKLGDKKITTKTIILALGRKPKALRNEDTEPLIGKGISFCSACDGPLFKNKDVAVIGGGNSALEEALYLSTLCNKVYIIHRRNEMRGEPILVDRIINSDNIEILYNSQVDSFNQENGFLSSIDINKEETKHNIKVSGCFIFIGYEPATEFLKDLDITNDLGYVVVNEKNETRISGIYAAGDIVKKEAYQIVTATSDGAIAALSCIKRLN